MIRGAKHDPPVAADPFVVEAFNDVLLALQSRRRSPNLTEAADQLERKAWRFLAHYLLTGETPPLV
jgi:hypothetical protein